MNENSTLREEMQRLSEECEKLSSENSSIKVLYSYTSWALQVLYSSSITVNFCSLGKQEELTRLCGPEAVAALEQNSTAGQSQANEE